MWQQLGKCTLNIVCDSNVFIVVNYTPMMRLIIIASPTALNRVTATTPTSVRLLQPRQPLSHPTPQQCRQPRYQRYRHHKHSRHH